MEQHDAFLITQTGSLQEWSGFHMVAHTHRLTHNPPTSSSRLRIRAVECSGAVRPGADTDQTSLLAHPICFGRCL